MIAERIARNTMSLGYGLVAVVMALIACGGPSEQARHSSESATGERALTVFTVNYPLAYFAERIGGDAVRVTFPVPRGEDPAYWSPDSETVAAYQGADLVFLNGADYAKWVSRVSLPRARLVDTSAAFAERLIPLEETLTHSHGPEGEHAHGGLAFTTWLDPTLAIEQARAVGAALEAARPDRSEPFRERLAALEADLAALDRRLATVTAALGDRPVIFSHPVYQYLERRYALNGRSVHWEPGVEPGEGQWRELEQLLREHPARWMIWEGKPLESVASRLESLGVASVVFAPCANVPEEGNLLSVLGANVDRLQAGSAIGS